jgi:hypothetical protein
MRLTNTGLTLIPPRTILGMETAISMRISSGTQKSAGCSSRPPNQNWHARSNTRYLNNPIFNMDARELSIQSAIRDLESGVYTSQRAAAKAWGVPRSTLQDRLDGRQPRAIAHQHQQRLSLEQEEFLVDWILDEDSRAQPPSHARVREMAARILRLGGDHDTLGQRWV